MALVTCPLICLAAWGDKLGALVVFTNVKLVGSIAAIYFRKNILESQEVRVEPFNKRRRKFDDVKKICTYLAQKGKRDKPVRSSDYVFSQPVSETKREQTHIG